MEWHKRKYIGRAYRDYFKSFTSNTVRVDEGDLKGYAALIKVDEVTRPLIVGLGGAEVCLYDDGYSDLQFLPDGSNWRMSAMYDERGEIIEWYFDVTRRNGVDENGEPYADDLYLDAVLMPDGRIIILDEDELLAALDSREITCDEYDMAYNILDDLLRSGIISTAYVKKLCARLLALF